MHQNASHGRLDGAECGVFSRWRRTYFHGGWDDVGQDRRAWSHRGGCRHRGLLGVVGRGRDTADADLLGVCPALGWVVGGLRLRGAVLGAALRGIRKGGSLLNSNV
jgi:hypothetical protein